MDGMNVPSGVFRKRKIRNRYSLLDLKLTRWAVSDQLSRAGDPGLKIARSLVVVININGRSELLKCSDYKRTKLRRCYSIEAREGRKKVVQACLQIQEEVNMT